jgi:DNA-binding CsgD family transcriptional regulator
MDVPELIGRAKERQELDEALRRARRGEGRAVFVVGEVGIGKSRLVREAAAAARDAGMRVLLGRASRTGPSSAMRPLAEALASLFRDGNGPSPSQLGPYRAALGGLVLDFGHGGAGPAPGPEAYPGPEGAMDAGFRTSAGLRTGAGSGTDAGFRTGAAAASGAPDTPPRTNGTEPPHGADTAGRPDGRAARTSPAPGTAPGAGTALSAGTTLGAGPDMSTGLPLAPSPLLLAEAVLRLTAAAGARQGCLLVLEDLHDADEQTLAVVEYLADNIAGQGSLLLATMRHYPGPAWELAHALARRDSAALLRPQRFTRAETALFAGSSLGVGPAGIPAEVVGRLWRDSAGNPLVADELLHAMTGAGVLVVEPGGCRFDPGPGLEIPFAVGHRITRHVRQLGPEIDQMLRTAAVIGERFPLSVLQRVLGVNQRKLLDRLRAALAAELLEGRGPTADWYGFRDPITRTAQLSQLAPAHRTALARRAADAVAQLHPGLPDAWCEFAAGLRAAAEEPLSAAALYGRAGRRALGAGHAGAAVDLLERAWTLLERAGTPTGTAADPTLRADLLDALLTALAEADRAGRGLEFTDVPQTFHGAEAGPGRVAGLHVRLARLAAAAGRRAEGRRQVRLAQMALGPGVADQDAAAVDAVAAWVLADSARAAESHATRAVARAGRTAPPDIRCRALTVRGAVALRRGSAEASYWLVRARTAALAHRLPQRLLEATYLLAEDEWLAGGERSALLDVGRQADGLGAAFVGHLVRSRLALDHALRGEYPAADRLARDGAAEAERLGLGESGCYLLAVRAVCAGHQGRRAELDRLKKELLRCPGESALTRSFVLGLAEVVCALLEEDRDRAAALMTEAVRLDAGTSAPHALVGQYGLFRLLTALDDTPAHDPHRHPDGHPARDSARDLDRHPDRRPDRDLGQGSGRHLDRGSDRDSAPGASVGAPTAPPAGARTDPAGRPLPATAGGRVPPHLRTGAFRLRWNASFDTLARAVAWGRQGRGEQAASAVAEAGRLAEPYPLALHLGLRLVAEAARADHWGDPVNWLRRAEEFFRLGGVPAPAGACRTMLRGGGVVVPHRRNVAHIPRALRVLGVTEREFEVLQLLTDRPDNRSIAAQLFISPRTVEKHVASLIAKTGQPDRTALRAYVVEGGAAD